jgi:hypothetical protein
MPTGPAHFLPTLCWGFGIRDRYGRKRMRCHASVQKLAPKSSVNVSVSAIVNVEP